MMEEGTPVRDASKLRSRVAIVLLGLFVLQSSLRLMGMMPAFQHLPIDVATVHALDLAALVGVTIGSSYTLPVLGSTSEMMVVMMSLAFMPAL